LTVAVARDFFDGQGGDPVRLWLLCNVQAWAERWYAAGGGRS